MCFRLSPCCICNTHNTRIYPWHNWQDHYKILHQVLWLPPHCVTLHTQVSSKPSAAHLHKDPSLAPRALTEPDVQCYTAQRNIIIWYPAYTSNNFCASQIYKSFSRYIIYAFYIHNPSIQYRQHWTVNITLHIGHWENANVILGPAHLFIRTQRQQW